MTTALLVLNGSLIAGIYAFAKAGTASALCVLPAVALVLAGVALVNRGAGRRATAQEHTT